MKPRGGEIRIGISGWTYAPWRGVFYPKGLPQTRELAYAAQQFCSIEINGTFYGMLRPDAFAAWATQVPEDFVFAVKGPRFITHLRRLRDAETPLANFIASGLLRLGPKLGPILWQLPPNFRFDAERIGAFLKLLPHDTVGAARLGRKHDNRLKTAAWLKVDAERPMRHAFEIRHESFRDRAFIDVLRRHNVALVCADSVEWPRLVDITSDFVYCRLHGSEQLYASGYDGAALDDWAQRVVAWARGRDPDHAEHVDDKARRRMRDVFVYFDNDAKARAPADAVALMRRVEEITQDHSYRHGP
jgi:uncharacterized protein YecE (DUF72 family)